MRVAATHQKLGLLHLDHMLLLLALKHHHASSIYMCATYVARGTDAQTRQGAPALIRTMQNDKCRARAKSGPLMAIMTLLRPGGTAQGLGGRFRWGQRVPRGVLDMRNSPRPFGASCPDR